jgi:hypothetical protein
MTLSGTLKLLRLKENKSGSLLNFALSLKRYRERSDIQILRRSDAFYLPAVNSKARIKWGAVFIQETFKFFRVADDENSPVEPVFLVTIADKSHLTTDQPQQINLVRIKRKLGAGLKGLSYIGMIEPGYYNVIYDEAGTQRKNVVSWHGHFVVWGVTEKRLVTHLEAIKPNFTPIMPGLCAVHKKTIPPDQFGYKLWYILKSPCKEYSIGQRRERDDKSGAAKFKQNSRKIRPGSRVKLFHLLREMYLDQLAMASRSRSICATPERRACRGTRQRALRLHPPAKRRADPADRRQGPHSRIAERGLPLHVGDGGQSRPLRGCRARALCRRRRDLQPAGTGLAQRYPRSCDEARRGGAQDRERRRVNRKTNCFQSASE